MKRLAYFLLILVITALACSIQNPTATATKAPIPETTEIPATENPATESPAATEALPTPPEPTVQEANVHCNELSFYLDPSLATDFQCSTVPASTEGMEVYPQYTQVILLGYLIENRFFEPQINVYPLHDFEALLPDVIPAKVAQLQGLSNLNPTGDQSLPFLPNFNAQQEFFAQFTTLHGTNSDGIRFITQYSQFFDPINNHEVFYTYQGLSIDGNYWITAILPVSNPILPEDSNTLPNGMSQEQFANAFPTYIQDITTQLNAESTINFTPDLSRLDGLVASIGINQ